MPQDITPNNDQQSATTTNTMSPKNISAQSAGSITPTIISQSNADRRRRANNERERRSRQNLGANVERSEIEREYRRLREAEEAANRRAEERKAAAKREKVTIYSGGVNSDLKIERVSIGDYLGSQLRGASDPIATPDELSQYMAMNGSGESGDFDSAYKGLDRLRQGVNALLEREAKEKTMIENVRTMATLSGASASRATYTPMTAEAIEAHVRLINDKNTSAEMKAQLQADLNRDIAHAESTGRTVNLTQAAEKNLSENWYRGGTKEQKEIAGKYLAAAGSTYGKEDFNKSADSIYASQAGKQRAALENRWGAWSSNELKQTGIDAKTREAIKANRTIAGQAVSAIDTARLKAVASGDQSSSFAAYNAEKQRQQAVAEKNFEKQNKAIQEKINGNSRYVNSILRVGNGNTLDLSREAFFKEQKITEKIYGSDWTSAGGKTAADAIAKGKRTTSYSEFKAAPGFADEEYILVDREGKQRYTLRKGNTGGAFAVYSWSGDIVASGQNSKGLAGALKELNVPFDEKNFNAFRPETAAQKVYLESETDISGINTAAALKASILGTSRSNETVLQADSERRTAEARQKEIADAVGRKAALNDLDAAMMSEVGYTLRIGNTNNAFNIGNLESTAPVGIYVKDNAADKSVVMGSDLTVVRNREVDDFYNSVTGAVDAFKATVPGPSLNELVFGSSKGKKETRKETKKDTDFVFENKDSELNGLSGWLIGGTEYLKGGIDEINKFSKDVTGKNLIGLDYEGDTAWSDIAGVMARPGLFAKRASLALALDSNTEKDAFKINPAIELQVLTQRSLTRQAVETPMYAGGIVKIADSIKSSYDKGGTDSAIAATAFWGAQAAEGTIAEAIKDPKKLSIDLAAGAAVGMGLSVATKPIRVAGMTAAKTGAKSVGVINTQFRALDTGGYVKSPRSLGIDALIKNKTVDLTRVERVSVFNRELKASEYFNKPTHNDPNDLYGGRASYVQWGSGNAAQGEIRDAGGRVIQDISSGLFLNKGAFSPLKNRILHYKNVQSGMQALSEEDIAEIIRYRDNNIEIPHERQAYYYNKVQDFATRITQPVAFISPKTLNFIGGKNRPRDSSLDAENEWALIPPKPTKNTVKAGNRGTYQWKFPSGSKRFVGFEEKYSTPIFEIDLAGKSTAKPKRFWMYENARDTFKDVRISRNGIKPEIYLDSAARYDAALSKYKIQKTSGELPYNSLDELAYGSHGKEHIGNVAANLYSLRAGSQNPKFNKSSDRLLNSMAQLHDSFKLEDDETFIPHATRTEFLIRKGYLDDVVKGKYGLDDKEKQIAARAVGRHTNVQPKILSKIRYRPTATDKALATADRLDLTRFGIKPDPKKMFLRDVLDEPWSWESGQLMPPKPRTGTFDLSAYQKTAKKPAYRPKKKTSSISEGSTSKYLGTGLAFNGAFASAYGLSQGKNKESIEVRKQNRGYKGGQSKVNFDKFFKGEQYGKGNGKGKDKSTNPYKKNYDEKYGKKKYNKQSYYPFKSKYQTKSGYPKAYEPPKPYPKKYNSKYGKYAKSYVMKPYSEMDGYKMGYVNKGSYVMGKKYEGKPYLQSPSITHGYSPKPAKAFTEVNKGFLKGKSKDKGKDKKRLLNLSKFRRENVEIPIVRGEEAFLGKKMKPFERPANRRTVYQIGYTNTFTKPDFTVVLKKRRK